MRSLGRILLAFALPHFVLQGQTCLLLHAGSQITPDVVVLYNDNTLVKDTDYTVEYGNNTNAGIATITITGKGNFTGTKNTTFNIVKINPVYNAPTAKQDLVYTGEELPLINAGSSEHGTVYIN